MKKVLRPEHSSRVCWKEYAILGVIILAAIAIRVPGIFWLVGAGPTADYSFMTDDQRFVDLSKNFQAGTFDGYVYGMTTHLLALEALLAPVIRNPNPLQLLRVVTIGYAALTCALVFAFSKLWFKDSRVALYAAFFLSVAPLYVATSNFGTADVTAVFYFYLALYAGVAYLDGGNPWWFVLASATVGAAIAVKFFLPLLAPLALLVFRHRGRHLLIAGLVASVTLIVGFEGLSLFSYRPGYLVLLLQVLRRDVVANSGGNGPATQLLLYLWDMVSATSVPIAGLLFAGACLWGWRACRRLPAILGALTMREDWRNYVTGDALVVLALSMYALSMLFSGVHAVRYMLVFLPIGCIGAARTLVTLTSSVRMPSWAHFAAVVILITYCGANAVALENLFMTDIRGDLAVWAQTVVAQGKFVLTLSGWSQVKGSVLDLHADPTLLDASTLVVSCDLEFNAYLRSRSAATHRAFGGQRRSDFFWDVYEGRSPYRIVKVFRQRALSPEQKLIDMQWLRPVGTFVPKLCVVLGRDGAGASAVGSGIWPKHYYTAGW